MEKLKFTSPVFGPIHSRRLGSSLGINLMPASRKVCNFNCIYCECGWNPDPLQPGKKEESLMPGRETVALALEKKLRMLTKEGKSPDAITFSGNGEPTLHPGFSGIVQDTVALKNKWSPGTKVCVLSNSANLDKKGVMEGLMMADLRIMKIDSAIEETLRIINNPTAGYSLQRTVSLLKRFGGDFTLQTMFLTGSVDGKVVDNTTEQELEAWFALVDELKPRQVMVYTLDRKTPAPGLKKCPAEKLDSIARVLKDKGIDVIVAG
ncbi:MAG: radical SAM protein [Bacteroidales bacterium]|nr:radical SAM protein [Bacteroidales bacterium]MDD3521521.1 radical SAM protein [Bacteroidales bacterium]MDD4031338.1 radical SAM protein [Bacteroidales bacterium]MDD4436224.1 radical SAM protein [Bacteroidales bacterium]